jgi:hypothetical protein
VFSSFDEIISQINQKIKIQRDKINGAIDIPDWEEAQNVIKQAYENTAALKILKSKVSRLKDDFESFPLSFNDDCTINLLNSKILNLLDELNNLKGINYFRLVFHEESIEQMRDVINLALDKLNNKYNQKCFDGKIHTHGNYKKQLL